MAWLWTAGSVHSAQAWQACRLGNRGTCGPAWISLFVFSSAESQYLRNVFYSHCTWSTHLDCCTAVTCNIQGCFQTQQGITASSSFTQMRNRRALNTAIVVLPTGQVLSQPAPTNWTRSPAHFWLQHLSVWHRQSD